MDFAVPVVCRKKIKESKKIDKYLDLARELKKLWNMKLIVIPIVHGALVIVLKRLEKIQGLLKIRRIETIQTRTFLRSLRIPRRDLEV